MRVSADEERAAKERLAEHVNEECARCGTSHLAVNESTLTLGCPACQEIRYVSLPKGILSVGGPPRKLTPEEEEEAAWASHQSREE